MKKERRYDLVMCVGEQHLNIAKITLKYIIEFLIPNKIYVITHKNHFESFQNLCLQHNHIVLVDEYSIDNIQYNTIQDFIKSHAGNEKRTGWYFQQFLKMQAFKIVENQHYLIWDADTIPLKTIDFFNKDDKILIQTSNEHHLPYFETLKNLLGLDKQVPYSFITEHMMVNRIHMGEFIKEIQTIYSDTNWPLSILSNINKIDLSLSGFSEYESFGNYLVQREPTYFDIRKHEMNLNTYRFGSQLFGKNPSEKDLQLLKTMDFSYVTFEEWDHQELKIINRNKRLANLASKIASYRFLSFLERKIISKIKKQIKN